MTFRIFTSLEWATVALVLPLAVSAQEAKPGQFKIPGTETTLTLNGFIEADAVYDFAGADEDIRGSDWASFVAFQPLDEILDQQEQPSRLYFTARTSRIGLTTETPTKLGPLTARMEADFNSPTAFNYSTEATTNGVNFRLRHAYGEFAGLLVGQTWSNFIDLGSLPDTVDFNPHGAHALTRQPMVRYTLKLAGPSVALSLENPQSIVINSPNVSLTVGRRFDRYPDLIANVTFPFALGHLNARGVLLEYNGQTETTLVEDHQWGWGAGVSGSLKFAPLALVWSVQGGDGIGRYTFQSLLQGAAFVGDDIQLWRSIAYHAGLTFAWTSAIRSNIIWTQTFFETNDPLARASSDPETGLGDIGANKRIDVLFVNTFFNPITNAELGIEYAFGRRRIFDSAAEALAIPPDNREGTQHRINALARYRFF
jgi:hypothetical protein